MSAVNQLQRLLEVDVEAAAAAPAVAWHQRSACTGRQLHRPQGQARLAAEEGQRDAFVLDIAVAGVASYLEMDLSTRVVKTARIALAAVAPTPVRATEAERVLEGNAIDDALIARAGEAAVESARPISDIRGGAEYRRELVNVLTRRTLEACVARIDGKQ